jgi:short-subunit dehydrogenase involved in D-alanine esterification of teichoic acids
MSEKGLVVITGASSGIGEATARSFSDAGHPLLLLARRLDRLEALKLPNTLCEKVDVTNRDQIRLAIEKAEQQYGPTDCLVNNAGVMLLGLADTQDPKEWEQMVQVNIMGVLVELEQLLMLVPLLDVKLLPIIQFIVVLNLVFMHLLNKFVKKHHHTMFVLLSSHRVLSKLNFYPIQHPNKLLMIMATGKKKWVNH